MQCEDFASSLAEKKTVVEGRTRSGQVFLRTIGHLFLGNFRRRLARVLVRSSPCFDGNRNGVFPRGRGTAGNAPKGVLTPSLELRARACYCYMCSLH